MGLLDFPCGRRDTLLEEDKVAPEPVAVAAEWASPEKRRRRAASRGSGSLWRPSLLAISEDAALAAASQPQPPPKAAVAAKGAGSRKGTAGKAKAATRVASRTVKIDYGSYGVVPNFSPTAFLF